MVQLGPSSEEVLELEPAERLRIIGAQRDRDDLTGLGIGEVIDQSDAAEHGVGSARTSSSPAMASWRFAVG